MSGGSPSTDAYVGEDDSAYFRTVYGKKLNALNAVYLLPVDEDAVKRSELHHRLLQFLFRGRNYLGPVKEALQFGQQRRILDLGTGGGSWAIAMADEFPRAEVIGVDLAPIQPRMVPSNCTFELCDLDQMPIPYPDNYFDFIHARSMHIGIRDYPRFLKEITRLLRPGGLVLLIEPSLHPAFSNASVPVAAPQHPNPPSFDPAPPPPQQDSSSQIEPTSLAAGIGVSSNTTAETAPVPSTSTPTAADPDTTAGGTVLQTGEQRGWITFWETYRACLRSQGIDTSVPERLPDLLSATGQFGNIIVQKGNIPVGFWPQDENLLTVGQLQWMDYELFLPAVKPFFLSLGLPPSQVDRIIKDAQHDLYFPSTCQSSHLHIVYASKSMW